MNDENIFEKYLDNQEKGFSGFFKKSKSWVLIIAIVTAIVLVIAYYKIAIVGGMSAAEVKNSIRIVSNDSIWVDKAITSQGVTIVPSVIIKVQNIGKRPLQYVDFQAVFIFDEAQSPFDDGMTNALRTPLNPGEISEPISIKSMYGYSASSKAAFLQNKEKWKKMKVKIFARSKGSGLIRIGGIYPIKQEIQGLDKGDVTETSPVKEFANEATQKLAYVLQIDNQDSLWVDKGVINNEIVVVPSITFQLKNLGKEELSPITIKAVFRDESTGETFTEGVIPEAIKKLAPGTTSLPVQLKGEYGYSVTSINSLIKNSENWKPIKVTLYAKTKETDYILLGTYSIKRKVLTNH